jgi:stearoyl-CoA desaturase (delta-9 desaturase)
MWNGLLDLTIGQKVITTLVMTHYTVMGVTLYLHRCQAHRAIDMHPIISHLFRFWLWATTGMITKNWVAVHRKHHTCSDQKDDPHSPQIYGIKEVFWKGVKYYRKAIAIPGIQERYGKGTPNDWLERKVYTPHSSFGRNLLLLVNIILFGWSGILIWITQMLWIPFWAAGMVNGLAHYWGYRNFEVTDAARNISPIAIMCGGEELHNNHHAFGYSAKFSMKWWELDIGWVYIKLFSLLGLCKVKHMGSVLKAPNALGEATDMAVFTNIVRNRLQIVQEFYTAVIQPVYQLAQVAGPCMDKLLYRNDAVMGDAQDRKDLANLLSSYPVLNTIYQYRRQLEEICLDVQTNYAERLVALKKWCQDAEATGIGSLVEFSKWFEGYLPKES